MKKLLKGCACTAIITGLALTGAMTAAMAADYPHALDFDQTNVLEIKKEHITIDYQDTTRGGSEGWEDTVYYVPKGTTITLKQNENFIGEILSLTMIDMTTQDQLIESNAETAYDEYEKYEYAIPISNGYGMNPIPMVQFKFDTIQNGAETIDFGNTGHLYALKAGLKYTVEGDSSAGDYFHIAYFRVVDNDKSSEKAAKTATPTASKVFVNGKEISFDAYEIDGNNYFKLRDIANVLSGTGKQFEVTWDSTKNAINLLSNKAYTAVGGELAKGDGSQKTAALNTSKVYLDGKEISLTAYTINDNNYFKLRDLGQTFNFSVGWDGAANTVTIDTSTGYTAE